MDVGHLYLTLRCIVHIKVAIDILTEEIELINIWTQSAKTVRELHLRSETGFFVNNTAHEPLSGLEHNLVVFKYTNRGGTIK